MKVTIIAAVVFALTGTTSAEVYGKCKLAKKMMDVGVPQAQVPDWVCLGKAVSGMETSKVTGGNYGIFQIPSDSWCMKGKAGNKCNVKCEDLVTKDISLSINCAQSIFKENGFQFWRGWVQSCKDKPLPDLHDC
uniref:lysozyme n=1 Tax=Lethocerus distinctifemur TaxID=280095 RepID=A0A2K8JLF7_9HEMI|nr:venom lysozyme [Lethocerus distinctifemur]